MSGRLAAVLDPPLDPSGPQARDLLRRELVDPDYHRTNPVTRLLDWVDRFLDRTIDSASQLPPLSTLAAMVAFLLLVLALAWLLSRARTSARAARVPGPLLEDPTLSAADLRAAARRAFAEGHYAVAVVEGFRALAVGQVERGWLEENPGATAHEVAVTLGAARPEQAQRVAECAALFDAVRYGDRTATREQAAAVLAADDALVGRR